MPSITFNNQRHFQPGTYVKTEVRSSLAGPLPDFLVPVILGSGHDGHGYDARAKSVANETEYDWYRLCTSAEEVGAYFGIGSAIHRAARFAFRHGLPQGYFSALNPMVRASVLVTSSGPTSQFTLHARKFGPAAGWTKIKWDGTADTLTLQRVKRFALLSANATTSAVRLYIQGGGIHDWLTPGATIIVGANDATGASRTIVDAGTEIASTGQVNHWIQISSAHGTALDTADYAAVLQYEDSTVEKTGLTSGQSIVDYFNGTSLTAASPDFVAVLHANFTGADPIDVASLTPLKEISAWGTVVLGTAPATTDGDATSWVTLMDGGARVRFENATQSIAQAFLLADSDDTRHGTLRDYAIARKTAGYEISVTTGCAWGDTVVDAGDTTDPGFRSATLNHMAVAICAGGLDREAACLSMAAAVFGRLVSGGVGHNLTNDGLIFSHLEKNWTETQLDTLHRKGVITQRFLYGDSFRYVISQGVNTLQANAVIWNESDATTWSIHQRDLAAYLVRAMKLTLNENVIGSDAVTPSSVAARVVRKASQLESGGFVKKSGFRILSIDLNAEGNGYNVSWTARLPGLVDYVALTTSILVGGEA